MSLDYQVSDPILVGSGELYLGVLPAGTDPETATDIIIEAVLKNVGAVESGCTLNIDKQMKDIKSGNRGLIGRFTADTKVELKSGVMTWNMDRLNELLGATVTTTEGERKTVINFNDSPPVVYLRFIHNKKDGGTLTINIFKAQADGKFDFKFDNEKPVTINFPFVSIACGTGNYLEILETFPEED